MERKIGEVFDFEGKKLKVVETVMGTCIGCVFKDNCNSKDVWKTVGVCSAISRTDKKQVIVVEVAQTPDEEPRKQEELNLCEVLKYCPGGEKFWSPMLGDVKFICLGKSTIPVEDKNGRSWDINPDSTMTIDGITSVEPMLYPSREQRDWSKVKYERPVENLPKTWDEFVREMGFIPEKFTFDGLYMELSDCMLAGSDDIGRYCDQHIAMVKLHALRDCYRQGWKPDDKNVDGKSPYAIGFIRKEGGLKPHIGIYAAINRFLSFQDEEHARLFLKCFEDIIKEAGDLI